MMVKKIKFNLLKKVVIFVLVNLLLVGVFIDNSVKVEFKKDDIDLKLVSYNVYMLLIVLYLNWRFLI